MKRVYKVENENKTGVLREYQDIFTGLGYVLGLHRIQLNADVVPIIHASRKAPVATQDILKK